MNAKTISYAFILTFLLPIASGLNGGIYVNTEANDSFLQTNIDTNTELNLDSDFEILADTDFELREDNGRTIVRLSNGNNVYLQYTPEQARERASLVVQGSAYCDDCEVELVEENYANTERPVYIVETEKEVRVLGLFNATMEKEVEIDAETGAILKIEEPWWTFLSSENNINIDYN